MTCIVGFQNTDASVVYIGGDSAVTWNDTIDTLGDPKVFWNGDLLMGVSGQARAIQLLRYVFKPPAHEEGDDMTYMVAQVAEAMRSVLKDAGMMKLEDNVEEHGNNIMVAYRGRLYEISSNFHVHVPASGWATIGCGSDIARGAMDVLADHSDMRACVQRSLEAAARHNAYVREPFVIEKQEAPPEVSP